MQHLNPERIAAIADEPATLVERSHLASCATCAAELAAAQRVVRMAMTDTPAIERPVSSWERLAPALRSQGLMKDAGPAEPARGGADVVPIGNARMARYRRLTQIAAGIFLAVGGAVIGRASAAAPGLMVAEGAPVDDDSTFTSSADALQALSDASERYQRAVAYLAANDSMVTMPARDAADLYQARLEVLDQAAAVTRAALYRAPQDPVLNQYYMTTLGARDYTLRQLGQVVPVSSTQRTRF